MSYNLQRELEGLPQRLEELEAALEALQIQVADASFFTQPHDYTQKVLAELSQLNRRWKRHLSAGSTLSL